ncbi:MAG: hypothetical protein Hyperionvirus16_30 [Hyperionvirus sp.]|uniref:E3 ubiquitin-protein ligase LAP n=1 Tax=Hyperionvirus sp. TaxID=2487770 RepID=A0A3G5A9Z4_9VIRU|nr:MAG: hypothetical protein Hyperionvirus16_30 [Hyperionvirus sp.]
MSNECRICKEEGEPDKLISPCKCGGSMKYVHIDCIERWRSTSANGNSQCETCKTFYKFKYGRIKCNRICVDYSVGAVLEILACLLLIPLSISWLFCLLYGLWIIIFHLDPFLIKSFNPVNLLLNEPFIKPFIILNMLFFAIGIKKNMREFIETFKNIHGLMREKSIATRSTNM